MKKAGEEEDLQELEQKDDGWEAFEFEFTFNYQISKIIE